jgi:mannonate dehydratase
MKMKMVFQWNGENDPVKLEFIRQIPGVYGVAGSLYGIADGELWPEDDIRELKSEAEGESLAFEAVSDLPVHEDVRFLKGNWARYIENYKENIARLSNAGIRCVCYSFTPMSGGRPGFSEDDGLWRNLGHFVDEIIPAAVKYGVNMAMYTGGADEESIDRFLALSREREHGLALCSGASGLGGYRRMVRKYGAMGRIHFANLRNLKIANDDSLDESVQSPFCGSPDMARVLKAYHDADFDGYVCPDGGNMVWSGTKPERGFYNGALGATYLGGIWDTLETFGY